jgi:hypothetical protein
MGQIWLMISMLRVRMRVIYAERNQLRNYESCTGKSNPMYCECTVKMKSRRSCPRCKKKQLIRKENLDCAN